MQNNTEQYLIGYIIYEIYMLQSEWRGETQQHITSPTISWKKKIYETISAAQEALAHMHQHAHRHGMIVPVYANVSDRKQVTAKYEQLKQEQQ